MFDNTHKKYNKVERIEKEECDGILDGEVYLFEKIDGANASAWVDNNLDICCGSRNRQVSKGKEVYDDFRGLVEYIGDHEGVYSFLNDFPNYGYLVNGLLSILSTIRKSIKTSSTF